MCSYLLLHWLEFLVIRCQVDQHGALAGAVEGQVGIGTCKHRRNQRLKYVIWYWSFLTVWPAALNWGVPMQPFHFQYNTNIGNIILPTLQISAGTSLFLTLLTAKLLIFNSIDIQLYYFPWFFTLTGSKPIYFQMTGIGKLFVQFRVH